MITDPPTTDSAAVPAPREKLDSEFSEEENKLEMADTQAEIILSQGLPRHIFNNLNQTSTAKEIWDNVEMLMQGSVPPTNNSSGLLQLKDFMATVHDGHNDTRHPTGTIQEGSRGEGHVARQCKEQKRKMALSTSKINFTEKLKRKECPIMRKRMTHTVDERPQSCCAFKANLSSTSAINNPWSIGIRNYRIQLKDMITSLRFKLDGLKGRNRDVLKKRFDELSKANYSQSRTAASENTKLKAQ
ncbi:hypothetical protein Tco_0000409 [Tanacetum coccineum]